MIEIILDSIDKFINVIRTRFSSRSTITRHVFIAPNSGIYEIQSNGSVVYLRMGEMLPINFNTLPTMIHNYNNRIIMEPIVLKDMRKLRRKCRA